jgi:ribonuclease D
MQLVETHAALKSAAEALAGAPRFFIDTEFESARGGALLCLLQVSAGAECFLIDTLKLKALEPLAGALAEAEWVVHAGAQDVGLLVQALGLAAPPSVFDTQVAWALSSPEYAVSLAYLKYRVLGIRSSKPHQADDWKGRPLSASQLEYAASDIEHLPALFDELNRRAAELGRSDAVREASRELTWPESDAPSALALDSFRNAWQLDPASQAALRFVIDWYNGLEPRERVSAPEPKALFSIAARLPETGVELARVKGVPRRWSAEHGDAFTGKLMRATAGATESDFVPIEPVAYATFEDIRLDAWLGTLRAEVCAELCIAPELAFPGRVLKRLRAAIAASGETADGARALDGWRRALLGEPYLAAAARHPAP